MAEFTVPDRAPFIQFQPDEHDGVTDFPFRFPLLAEAHLEVYVDTTLQTLGVDYTITAGVENTEGGLVVFGVAPGDATLVTFVRKTPIARGFNYGVAAGLPTAETLNNQDLNRIIMVLQELQVQLDDRMVGVPDSDVSPSAVFFPAGEADKFLTWDAAGDLVNSADTEVPVTTPASWINDVWHQVADAAEARTVLGLGTVALADFGAEAGDVPRMQNELRNAALRNVGKVNPKDIPQNVDLQNFVLDGTVWLLNDRANAWTFANDGIRTLLSSTLKYGTESSFHAAHPSFGGTDRTKMKFIVHDLNDGTPPTDEHTLYEFNVDAGTLTEIGTWTDEMEGAAPVALPAGFWAGTMTVLDEGADADKLQTTTFGLTDIGGGNVFMDFDTKYWDEGGLSSTRSVRNLLLQTKLLEVPPSGELNRLDDFVSGGFDLQGCFFGGKQYLSWLWANDNTHYRDAASPGFPHLDSGMFLIELEDFQEHLVAGRITDRIQDLLAGALIGTRFYFIYRSSGTISGGNGYALAVVDLAAPKVNASNWATPADVSRATILTDDDSATVHLRPSNWLTWGVDRAGWYCLTASGIITASKNTLLAFGHESLTPVLQFDLDGTALSTATGLWRVFADHGA